MKLIKEDGHILIIAEIGNNHNGNIKLAKELILKAKDSGCDIVKFQKRFPDLCVPEKFKNTAYKSPWGNNMEYIEYRKKIEFDKKEYDIIDDYCRRIGIKWFASSWDVESVKFLEQYNPPLHKVPSPCITDSKLINEISKTNRQTIISTGCATIEFIDSIIKTIGLKNLALAHCTSTYPCSYDELNLNVIRKFKERYHCLTGYSGHEKDLLPTFLAIALGASFIERHFTLDRSLPGSDHSFSLEPNDFKRLVSSIREIETALGDGNKIIYKSEAKSIERLRKYILSEDTIL